MIFLGEFELPGLWLDAPCLLQDPRSRAIEAQCLAVGVDCRRPRLDDARHSALVVEIPIFFSPNDNRQLLRKLVLNADVDA